MIPRVFLDTNILIDLILQRPGYEDSADILQMGCDGKISLCCSFLSMANLAFILRKAATPAVLVPTLMQINGLMEVLPMDNDQFRAALSLDGPDMEDIFQAVCASKSQCDYIVTRNTKDYKITSSRAAEQVRLPVVLSPQEFITQWNAINS